MVLTSAAGILSLLDDPISKVKEFALVSLNNMVDEFWPEISDSIEKIEILHEDTMFKERELAALVASKVYFHLGSYEDSLTLALGAGDLFDVNAKTLYVETTIAKAIDFYTQKRKALFVDENADITIDPRLEVVVNRMFRRCIDDAQFRQALGLAFETRRMDIFDEAIMKSDDVSGMLQYAFNVAMSLLQNRGFRNTVLRSLVRLYRCLNIPDYVNMCQCLIILDDPLTVAGILDKLACGSLKSAHMAYQIGFDLYDSATQRFISRVLEYVRCSAPAPSALGGHPEPQGGPFPEDMELGDRLPPAVTDGGLESLNEEQMEHQLKVDKLISILGGEVSISLQLQFLIRSNHADMLILKNTKEAIRVSICHTATVIANGFMHAGTTSDQFLRDNLEWLARSTNWAKFTVTASLGVIHRGHEIESLALMQSYLPKETGPATGFSEGGGLYALGLIHANHGENIVDYLLTQLKDAQNETVRHGGCLGLGLAAMGSYRQDIYEQLKFNLYQDDAVTGEAAGIAMGMVMLGSNLSPVIDDMMAYAQDSQHEKILRGLAVGIAFLFYGRLEEADSVVEQLLTDQDPLLRRSGCFTIAMAYSGSGNNNAIRKLLHVAVSDVNDDVRRASVTALGFILFRTPEQCPSLVSLLAESYNPHVRYGAAMAVGIACAGTGNREALNLLEPMVKFDSVNFVRQGALIASAFILIQQTEGLCPKVTYFRQLYAQIIANKHEDMISKFGAILAQGIIDAGGRNVTISLQNRTGHMNLMAVVGMLVFTQYWYWYPLVHFISLAFTPTCLIALNSDLNMPMLDIKSNSKPSLYAYPAPLEEKKREEKERVTTAILSSAAAKARKKVTHSIDCLAGRSMTSSTSSKMDVDEEEETPTKCQSPDITDHNESEKDEENEDSSKEDKEDEEKEIKEKQEPEPNFEILSNPARVMNQQLKGISIVEGSGFIPVKDVRIGGIVMLTHYGEGEQALVEPVAAYGPKAEEEVEPEPPETFEYLEE